MKGRAIQTSWNAGQWSPFLEGRVDLAKYVNACKKQRNMLPTIQGPSVRRPGTRYVAAARSSGNVALIDFESRANLAYMLEFGDKYIRVFSDRARVVVTGADAYNEETTYAVDDYVTYSALTYRSRVASNTGNQPDTSPTEWEQTSDLIVTTPYDETDVLYIRYTQSIDVLYLVHPDYPPHKLERFGATDFRLTEIDFKGGPFLDQNEDEAVTVYASAATGTGIGLTASDDIFLAGHVGSLFQIESEDLSGAAPWETNEPVSSGAFQRNEGKVYQAQNSATTGSVQPTHTSGDASDGGVTWRYSHDFVGIVRITAVGSATSATADVVKRLPADVVGSGNETRRWAHAAWSDVEGYPRAVTFWRERLTFGKDDFIDASFAQDFENFTAREFGEVLPENAIRIRVVADQLPEILWLSPQDALVAGTTGVAFVVQENTTNDPLGPDNVKASPQIQYGSADMRPVQVGEATLFVQRKAMKLREGVYSFESDRYIAPDMTVFSDQITSPGISSMAYQGEPGSVVFAVKTDGEMVTFTYDRPQEVTGWAEQALGGYSDDAGTGAKVKAVATLPDPSEGRDDVWLVVERYVDGATVKYIEFMERKFDPLTQDQSEAFYVDCGLTYDEPLAITGISSDTITIANHGLVDGDRINLRGIVWKRDGTTFPDDLNRRKYMVANATTNTFTLQTLKGVNIEIDPVYSSGGQARKLVTTISELDHLEGETISCLVDGGTHPDVTVESGAVTLQTAGGTVQFGYTYNSDIETMRIEVPTQIGTAQGQTKRFSRCYVRVDQSGTFKYGPDKDTLDIAIFRNAADPMDTAVSLFTGDVEIVWNGGYEKDGRRFFRQELPLPFTLVALVTEFNT